MDTRYTQVFNELKRLPNYTGYVVTAFANASQPQMLPETPQLVMYKQQKPAAWMPYPLRPKIPANTPACPPESRLTRTQRCPTPALDPETSYPCQHPGLSSRLTWTQRCPAARTISVSEPPPFSTSAGAGGPPITAGRSTMPYETPPINHCSTTDHRYTTPLSPSLGNVTVTDGGSTATAVCRRSVGRRGRSGGRRSRLEVVGPYRADGIRTAPDTRGGRGGGGDATRAADQ